MTIMFSNLNLITTILFFHILIYNCCLISAKSIRIKNSSDSEIENKLKLETHKIRIIVKLLEDCTNDKEHFKCFITYDLAKEALDEVDSWDPRGGIRLKRAEPLINCAEWLLRPLVFYGKDHMEVAWKKLELNYKLFRNQCKLGLIDYFIAHGDNLQNLASALLWELKDSPKLSDNLFSLAKKEYNDYFESYYKLESNQENFDQIEWTLQYLNSRAARSIMKKIMPLYESGKVSPDTLRDVFTDDMRYLGNFVELGQQHYFNYDVDIIPILKPKHKELYLY